MGWTTIAHGLGMVAAIAAAACTATPEGAPERDAALSDGAGDGSLEASDTAACVAAGGQCEVGAICDQVAVGCGSGGAVCCLHVICAADANVRLIQASDFERSCSTDSDCIEVTVGNACTCDISCSTPSGAINKGAEPQYTAAVTSGVACSCLPRLPIPLDSAPMPCCVGGTCKTVTGQCPTNASAVDAAADSGARNAAPYADAAPDGGAADAGSDGASDSGSADGSADASSDAHGE